MQTGAKARGFSPIALEFTAETDSLLEGAGLEPSARNPDLGRNLGIVFQPVDDMLDFSARQTELSKSIGDDFRGGKITLPILLAFTRGDEKERTLGRRFNVAPLTTGQAEWADVFNCNSLNLI